MDKNNPTSLKASMFGGYKKKDVLSYIFELNESSQDAQQKFAEQIEELSQSREALVKELAEMETRLASTQASLDETTAKLDEAYQKNTETTATIERLRSESDALIKNAAQKADEIKRVSAMHAELSEKYRTLDGKREDVELAASQIASLLVKAQADSGRLIREAEAEAEKIKAAAREQADDIIKKAQESAGKHIKDAHSTFGTIYSQFEAFCAELEDMKTAIINTTSEMHSRVESIDAAAAKTRGFMPELPDTSMSSISLSYYREDDPGENDATTGGDPADEVRPDSDEPSAYTNDILNKYGVRKDDSGFFRLAAER